MRQGVQDECKIIRNGCGSAIWLCALINNRFKYIEYYALVSMNRRANYNYEQVIQTNGTRLLWYHYTSIHTRMASFNTFVTRTPLLCVNHLQKMRLLPHYLPTRWDTSMKNQASSIKHFYSSSIESTSRPNSLEPNDLSWIISIILHFCTSRTSKSTSCLLFHQVHATSQWQPVKRLESKKWT